MLVLNRKVDETIRIGDDIIITVKEFSGARQVRLGIQCPKSTTVLRGEIYKPQEAQSAFYLWWVRYRGTPPQPGDQPAFDAARAAWFVNKRSAFTEHSPADIRAQIYDQNPEALFFENPDYAQALIGMTSDGRAVYDYNLCIDSLIEEDIDWEEASDFFSSNTIRALDYFDAENRPVILTTT